MMQRRIEVRGPQAGRTVQRILRDEGGFSHAFARGLLAAGCVRRNGRLVERADERVEAGDRIEFRYDPGTRYRAPRVPHTGAGYTIVYEDREVVVADKPAGLLTLPTPSRRGDSLLDELTEAYRARGHRNPTVRPVHRIDRFTSGLVAFARTGAAYRALRAQFRAGLPERVYLAVALGRIAPERGELVHFLAEHPKSLKVHSVTAARGGRRAACTYRVVERFPHATLLEVTLETGRRNQIRVQFAAEGHPLLGDQAYGEPSGLIDRTALHAARLAVDHPTRRIRLELEAPLPGDLRRLLRALRRGSDAHSPTRTRTPV